MAALTLASGAVCAFLSHLKEGKEVVISSQEKETPRIERLLKEGKLAYISKATLPSEPTNSTQGNQSTVLGGAILSESKDTTTEPITQEIEQENLQPTPPKHSGGTGGSVGSRE